MGTYAAPLVAEKLGVPMATMVLQPQLFLSAYDPPVPAAFPWLTQLSRLGPGVTRTVLRWVKSRFGALGEPVHQLRAELGLPSGENPIFEGQFSPLQNLACFSPRFGPPQPDWPPHTCLTGFLHPPESPAPLPLELEAFLNAGAPPVVFTLGSLLVWIGERFFQESILVARQLGCRAVFLVGDAAQEQPLPEGMITCAYASHAALFPRAAAVVHHGGIGTTAEALRTACSSLEVPYCHDQPDNARRVWKLGAGRVLPWSQYHSCRAAGELRRLLEEPIWKQRAAALGTELREEDGVRIATGAVERCLTARSR